jgi:hypothetical protein
MVAAITNPDDPEVALRLSEAGDVDGVPMVGRQVAKRGHEAPVDSLDPDAIETFAGYVLDSEVNEILGI